MAYVCGVAGQRTCVVLFQVMVNTRIAVDKPESQSVTVIKSDTRMCTH